MMDKDSGFGGLVEFGKGLLSVDRILAPTPGVQPNEGEGVS